MSPYMLGDAAKAVSTTNPPVYDLYGIVSHYGNTYKGHYTAMIRPSGGENGEPGRWLVHVSLSGLWEHEG